MKRHKLIPGAMRDPRFWGLFAVSLVFASRGLAYLIGDVAQPLPRGLLELGQLGGFRFYGVLWLIGAVLGIWLGLGHNTVWAVALMTGMPTLWGLCYGLTWVLTDFTSRDWTAMALFLCLSVIVVSFGLIRPQRMVSTDGSSG